MNLFKNRKINYDEPVKIYRCLNKKGYVFSIMQNNLVVAHTNFFVVKNPKFKINESGKIKAIQSKIRNVHAFIEGYLGEIEDILNCFSWTLLYEPFKNKGFYIGNSDDPKNEIKKAQCAYVDKINKRVLIQI